MLVYKLLDGFFMILHTAVILFNLAGWIFPKTRRLNLILLLLTGASWFILGLWKGIGYCPLTDWHFEVLIRLGVEDMPASYIAYLMQRLLGWRLSDEATDYLTLGAFVIALTCSIIMNTRSRVKSTGSPGR